MSAFEVSVVLFLELAVVLAACRLVALLVRPLRQPLVVGEMIAGVLLGPSLFGWLAPELHARLFPKPALAVLYCLSQVGLALYVFVVGLDFDLELVRRRVRSAMAVSWVGIVAPFGLGAALAYQLQQSQGFFGPAAKPLPAMLFLGAAMSITAFPVLARIVRENGLNGTSLGTLALAAGSADDAAAWCLLAVALGCFGGKLWLAALAVGGGLAFVLLAFKALRPLLAALAGLSERPGLDGLGLSGALILLALSAFFTDSIGLHAVFGAFVLGVAVPRGELQRRLKDQIEPLTGGLLVPLFFACSGLNTRLDLVVTSSGLLVALLVLAIACLGKGLACYAAARWQGEDHRDSLAVGALMNARGLMELILLGIGLEIGLITPLLFSIMVLMAVVTTLMATPLFQWVYSRPAAAALPLAEGEVSGA